MQTLDEWNGSVQTPRFFYPYGRTTVLPFKIYLDFRDAQTCLCMHVCIYKSLLLIYILPPCQHVLLVMKVPRFDLFFCMSVCYYILLEDDGKYHRIPVQSKFPQSLCIKFSPLFIHSSKSTEVMRNIFKSCISSQRRTSIALKWCFQLLTLLTPKPSNHSIYLLPRYYDLMILIPWK